MELILVRHGLAEGQVGKAIGHTDLVLSESGADAIRRLAGTAPTAPSQIISSDLARARESAALLAAPWALTPTVDARLREMDFGRWDGRTWAEIEAEDAPAMMAWMGEWWNVSVPGGEGFGDVRRRVRAWHDDLLAEGRTGPVWVVTHAGVIRALLVELLQWPAERAYALACDHAHVTVLRHGGDGVSLRCLNSPSFLG